MVNEKKLFYDVNNDPNDQEPIVTHFLISAQASLVYGVHSRPMEPPGATYRHGNVELRTRERFEHEWEASRERVWRSMGALAVKVSELGEAVTAGAAGGMTRNEVTEGLHSCAVDLAYLSAIVMEDFHDMPSDEHFREWARRERAADPYDPLLPENIAVAPKQAVGAPAVGKAPVQAAAVGKVTANIPPKGGQQMAVPPKQGAAAASAIRGPPPAKQNPVQGAKAPMPHPQIRGSVGLIGFAKRYNAQLAKAKTAMP